ncbi:hypothetical protein ACSBR2_040531 [Camellia fascicularis]
MEGGGWTLVIRKRKPSYHQIHRRGSGLITVFVDNLPKSMVPKSLFTLFSSYGVEKDVFVSNKRRKAIGSRFGFVRYDCQIAAKVAVQKANGIWCDDMSLKVRIAEFGNDALYPKKEEVKKCKSEQMEKLRYGKLTNGGTGQRSYADAVQGTRKEKGKVIEQERCVWLACYGIPVNLWNTGTFKEIGTIYEEVIQHNVDTSNAKSFLCGKVRIITNNRDFINQVILLECNGKQFPVRVVEELLSPVWLRSGECSYQYNEGLFSIFGNEADMNSGAKDGKVEGRKENDSRADVACSNEVASIVKDTVEGSLHATKDRDRRVAKSTVREPDNGLGNSTVEGDGHDGVLKRVDKFSKNVAEQPQSSDGSKHMDGFIHTDGLLKSLSGPETVRPNINLEVVLHRTQVEDCPARPVGLSLSNLSDCVAQSQFMVGGAQVFLKEREDKIDMGREENISHSKGVYAQRRRGAVKRRGKTFQKGRILPKSFNRGAIFRAAAVAISNSQSFNSESSRRRGRIFKEAKATIQLEKSLGIDFGGKEDDLVDQIVQLEDRDLERIAAGARTADV